jgi:hypothetical protein
MKQLISLAASAALLVACGDRQADESPQDAASAAPQSDAVESATQAAPLIPRDVIFGNPDRTLARISPDGAHVSWLAPKDGVLNVWVAPSDNPSDARVITNDTYRGISQYFWAPNSAFVYYIQDQGGDENFHVYSANIETGDVVDLTPVKDGARATVESISSQRPDEIVVGINERNAQLFDLYLVDVMTGERELLKENPGFAGWLIDNNLDPRFGFQPTPDGGGNIVDFEGEVFAVIPPEDFLSTSAVGFNAANDAVLILDSRGRDTAALTQVALGSGEVEVLAENDEADISGIFIDRRTLEPIAYNVNHLKSQWYPVDDTTAALTTCRSGSCTKTHPNGPVPTLSTIVKTVP